MRTLLEEQGFDFHELAHGHFSARRGRCSVGYYLSGKLVVQGKEAREFIEFGLEPRVLGEARLGYEEELDPEQFAPHFGIDEAGKGDFFGPLVIAGAYVDGQLGRALREAGVRDSKKVGSDARVRALAAEVRRILGPQSWEMIRIGPAKYNELYGKFRNLNRLLAWGHARIILNLKEKRPGCVRALSDQFAHRSLIERQLGDKAGDLVLEQRTKAESDVAVAAASILAREGYINGLRDLGEAEGVLLPKGSGVPAVAAAALIAGKGGAELLERVAKRHFKTFAEAVGKQPEL